VARDIVVKDWNYEKVKARVNEKQETLYIECALGSVVDPVALIAERYQQIRIGEVDVERLGKDSTET